MTDAYRCDICGQLWEGTPQFQFLGFAIFPQGYYIAKPSNDIYASLQISYHREVVGKPYPADVLLDLCPNCVVKEVERISQDAIAQVKKLRALGGKHD